MRITTIIYGFIFMHIGVAHYKQIDAFYNMTKNQRELTKVQRQRQQKLARAIVDAQTTEDMYKNLKAFVELNQQLLAEKKQTYDPFSLKVPYADFFEKKNIDDSEDVSPGYTLFSAHVYQTRQIPLKDAIRRTLNILTQMINHLIDIDDRYADEQLALYEKIIHLLPPDIRDPLLYSRWLAEAKERRNRK
jgi:hypothetical protein